jgi:hypothetical protein
MGMIVVFLFASLVGMLPAAWPAPPAPRLTAEQLREDLEFVKLTISENHPDLAFSTDTHALDETFRVLRSSVRGDMTRDEAWAWLAKLNPVLADGHLFVGYTDWRDSTVAHLKAGHTLFPYEVQFLNGELLIRSLLGGADTPLRGTKVAAIDGKPIDTITGPLLDRMHGDTPLFRSALLTQRWWLYYRKMYGAPASYRLTLTRGEQSWTVDVPGSHELPLLLRTEGEFDRQFYLAFDADGSAVLNIGSFALDNLERFLDFTREAFFRIQQARVTNLKIDISANGGGDDPAWIKGLMPYLATAPYRIGSTYKKRVTVENAGPGERVGQVVPGFITTWHQPHPDNPLLFKGRTQVVIAPGTYSSAVLFANVLNDFGFARLTGNGGAARRAQSGGVRRFTLPNSKLALWVPSFVLDPPVRVARGVLLEPGAPLDEARHNVRKDRAAH